MNIKEFIIIHNLFVSVWQIRIVKYTSLLPPSGHFGSVYTKLKDSRLWNGDKCIHTPLYCKKYVPWIIIVLLYPQSINLWSSKNIFAASLQYVVSGYGAVFSFWVGDAEDVNFHQQLHFRTCAEGVFGPVPLIMAPKKHFLNCTKWKQAKKCRKCFYYYY